MTNQNKIKTLLFIIIGGLFILQGCKKSDDKTTELPPILLECNYFAEDRVLEDDPNRPVDYIVPCVAAVSGNIVIKAGVVIEFQDDAGLNVNSGSLKIEGTASKKVVLTGVTKVKGSWRGIFFLSKSVNNSLDHAVVSYAGGNSFNSNNDRANVICYTCKVSITNTELSNGKEHGFNSSYNNTEIMAFENNVITGNDKFPVYSRIDMGYAFSGNNALTGNGKDYIYLKGGQVIGDDRTWIKNSVPYLIDGNLKIGNGESLTLQAGAELRFDFSSSIDIAAGGFLAVDGQPGNVVSLLGLAEQAGAWKGIINFSSDPRNVTNYAEIAHAGGGAHNSNGDLGTFIVWANAYQQVSNSILRDAAPSANCAINAYNSATIELSGNTTVNITHEICQ
jgi:hypothetical protein